MTSGEWLVTSKQGKFRKAKASGWSWSWSQISKSKTIPPEEHTEGAGGAEARSVAVAERDGVADH